MKGNSGETITRVFIGVQVGTDAVQGVLVAEQALGEWTELTENPDIPPEERSRRLLALIGSLASTGLLTYLSLRASSREVENLSKKPKHGPNEGQARSSGEKVADLTKPDGPPVDTTKPPTAEGHTKEEVHETQAVTTVAPQPNASSSEKTFEEHYPAGSQWQYRKVSKTHIKLGDRDRFYFIATCQNGTLTIEIVTKVHPEKSPAWLLEHFEGLTEPKESLLLKAEELYPRMYRHFEAAGNPVRKLVGSWAWVNYVDAKKEFDRLILAEKLSPEEAAKKAVLHARSWVNYHREQGFTHVLSAEHDAENKLFKFEIVRPK